MAGFAQGQLGDVSRGSAWLAALVAARSRPEALQRATDDEMLGIGRGWKTLETWCFSRKLAVVRELIRRYPLSDRDEPEPDSRALPDEWDPRLAHEVAAALLVSVVAAGKLVTMAWALEARLPGISQAMDDDLLDPARVRMIVDLTSVLEDGDMVARAEAIILAGLAKCKTYTALERLVQRAVVTVDPEGARRRREQAEREHARISFWRENAGGCAIQGVGLPADEALAAMAHVTALAQEYEKAGIARPVEILRVMAFCDLLNGVSLEQRLQWVAAQDAAREAEASKRAAHGDQGPGDGGAPGNPPRGAPCPECGSYGDGIDLRMKANLTLPAWAVPWLAGLRDQDASSARSSTPASSTPESGAAASWRRGTGPCPACGRERRDVAAREYLALPLLTLMGLAERPGEADGLGALDPDLVRLLATAGARHRGSEFCVTIVDEHGYAIGHGCGKRVRGIRGDPDRATFTPSARAGPDGGFGSWILTVPGTASAFSVDIHPVPTYDCDHRFATSAYRPGDQLRHIVEIRDGKCSFPACSRRARETDFEHARPFDQGGATCACNCHSCSRSCHRAKQSAGWQVTKPRPGWTQWTTMAGRVYEQGPWEYPA